MERVWFIADCQLPIADCRFPIADLRLSMSDCRFIFLPGLFLPCDSTEVSRIKSAIGNRKSAMPKLLHSEKSCHASLLRRERWEKHSPPWKPGHRLPLPPYVPGPLQEHPPNRRDKLRA